LDTAKAGTTTTVSTSYRGTGNNIDCSSAKVGDDVYLSSAGIVSLSFPTDATSCVYKVGIVTKNTNPGEIMLSTDFLDCERIGGNNIQPNSIGLYHHIANDGHSTFTMCGVHDIGSNGNVATDLGSVGTKSILIGGSLTVMYPVTTTEDLEEALVTIKATSPTEPDFPISDMRTIYVSKDEAKHGNEPGCMHGVCNSEGVRVLVSGAHVYAYTSKGIGRTGGKLFVNLTFAKVN
jgi:hypothetical protein